MKKNLNKLPPKGPNKGFGGWGEASRKWLENFLKSGNKTVVELGSGIGSRWLAERCNLISIEHNPEWLDVAGESRYIFAPIVNGWYSVEAIKKGLEGVQYDLLIIDGPPGTIGRFGIMRGLSLFDWDKTVFVDDTNRQAEKSIAVAIANLTKRPIRYYKDEKKDFAII